METIKAPARPIRPIPPRAEPRPATVAGPADILVFTDQENACLLVSQAGVRATRRAIAGKTHKGLRFRGVLNPTVPCGVTVYRWRYPGVFGVE